MVKTKSQLLLKMIIWWQCMAYMSVGGLKVDGGLVLMLLHGLAWQIVDLQAILHDVHVMYCAWLQQPCMGSAMVRLWVHVLCCLECRVGMLGQCEKKRGLGFVMCTRGKQAAIVCQSGHQEITLVVGFVGVPSMLHMGLGSSN